MLFVEAIERRSLNCLAIAFQFIQGSVPYGWGSSRYLTTSWSLILEFCSRHLMDLIFLWVIDLLLLWVELPLSLKDPNKESCINTRWIVVLLVTTLLPSPAPAITSTPSSLFNSSLPLPSSLITQAGEQFELPVTTPIRDQSLNNRTSLQVQIELLKSENDRLQKALSGKSALSQPSSFSIE